MIGSDQKSSGKVLLCLHNDAYFMKLKQNRYTVKPVSPPKTVPNKFSRAKRKDFILDPLSHWLSVFVNRIFLTPTPFALCNGKNY